MLDGGEAAADRAAALEAKRLQPGAAEVGLQDEAVVPRPQQNAVVRAQSARTAFILIDLSRKSFVYVLFTSNGLSMPM